MLTYNEKDISVNPYSKLTIFSTAHILHKHTFFEFCLVIDGQSKSIINNSAPQILNRGDFIFIKPQESHIISAITKNYIHRDFYVPVDKMKKICNILSDNFYDELIHYPCSPFYSLSTSEFSAISNAAVLFDTFYPQTSNDYILADLCLTSIVSQLLLTIIKNKTSERSNLPRWLNKLYLQITGFRFINNTVDEIIKTTGYSHSYVCKIFKKFFHSTLQEYLMQSKIIFSSNLLGQEKIIDIALTFGWENPKNYTIAFKKVFGITPQEYRKLLKEGISPLPSRKFSDLPHFENLKDFEKITEKK